MSEQVYALDAESLPVELGLSEAELEERRERITDFVGAVVRDAGADGAVIGLSGGIDSTLTAHLAVEALGADAVRGLVMPSEANTDSNMSDAERVAEELGIESDVVEVQPIVDAFEEAYPTEGSETLEERVETDPLRTALGNVAVRTRGVLNYFVGNAEDRIVLGTGNRSEALTGYFTKYGDQAVDCNPIGRCPRRPRRRRPDTVVRSLFRCSRTRGRSSVHRHARPYERAASPKRVDRH